MNKKWGIIFWKNCARICWGGFQLLTHASLLGLKSWTPPRFSLFSLSPNPRIPFFFHLSFHLLLFSYYCSSSLFLLSILLFSLSSLLFFIKIFCSNIIFIESHHHPTLTTSLLGKPFHQGIHNPWATRLVLSFISLNFSLINRESHKAG